MCDRNTATPGDTRGGRCGKKLWSSRKVLQKKGRTGCSKSQALVMRMTRNHRPLVDGRMKDLRRWRTEEMAAVGDGTNAQLHHHEGERTNYLCRLVRAEQGCAAQQRKR